MLVRVMKNYYKYSIRKGKKLLKRFRSGSKAELNLKNKEMNVLF